ncbi:hypothetical protein HYY71_05510 [Candidatus Woesearchaeota archaeon]|nr:hypothetical protein [Candidatus Woesearchaeota archaeon]
MSILAIGCGTSGEGASRDGTSSGSIGSFFGSSSSKKTTDVNIYVGTQGLAAEFVKGAPPPKVFESSSFPILIRIRNSGAYSLKGEQQPPLSGLMSIGNEKDYVRIVSVEKNIRASSGATPNEIWFDLEGKTQINPKGDEIVVAVNAQTGKLDPQSENKQSTLTATLCYPYKTTLSTTVCIDPDVAGIRPGKKVCAVKDISFGSGQGAPISVTRIEPQMIPIADKDIIKPQFLIFVENRGNGNSVNIVGYHNACREKDFISKDTWNAAALRAYASGKEGENQLVCCPNKEGQCPEDASGDISGFIRMRDKKDYVRCTFKEGIKRTEDAFTSPLRIEIDYGYVQTISTSFYIQKPLRY